MTKSIKITTSSGTESVIRIGDTLRFLNDDLPKDKKIIVITDENLLRHYGHILSQYPLIVIGTGEENKTMKTLEKIYHELLQAGADRSSFILGFGGGIVCDVAGYAASTYMRGIPFGFVSTSLLSQTDASVGGKNGINFEGYKNMIGTFTQPRFVLCDPSLFKTLPEREFRQGFAEVIKSALIRDPEFVQYLEENTGKALEQDPETLRHILQATVQIKADIVTRDEKEKGERRLLNFGHTFGHAIEKLTREYTHGEAVSIGMHLAAKISEKTGLLSGEKTKRMERLILSFGLPSATRIDPVQLCNALQKDKKREGQTLHLILLEDLGKATIKDFHPDEILQIVQS
ncbi:MAG: 3-dehydroquinate synthase [Bacteroidales bacterium]|nr:3-dehydroquinate synthase [Bacteroidales bacterium]